MPITSASCCCGVTPVGCLPHADFSITLKSEGAGEYFFRSTVESLSCLPPPAPPPPDCPTPDDPCTCTGIVCVDTYVHGNSWCDPGNLVAHYVSSFTMNETAILVPYVNTSTETVTSTPGCEWFADIGGTLTQSGLPYTGQRSIDNNQATVNYTRTFSGCSCCCVLTVGNGGDESQTIYASYGNRCTYLYPPAYMKVQRATPTTYLNWTWEITSGVFIVRNSAGVIQNSYTLAGNTLAAAQAAIDAFPAVVCIKTFTGTIPADSFDAGMMIDQAAQLLELSPIYDSLWLTQPDSIVETYQDGLMSPFWSVGNGLCGNRFYLKAGCSAPDSHDYTGGTDEAAELVFCTGICTEFVDWTTSYDPNTGINDTCGGWNNGDSTFAPCLTNYPPGHPVIVPGKGCAWEQDADCLQANPPTAWDFQFGAFGDRATDVCGEQVMCSDDSVSTPTSCNATSGISTCDFCSCDSTGQEVGTSCFTTFSRNSWKVTKSFQITRL